MAFNSAIFVFIFAPFVLITNLLLPQSLRNAFLLIVSIIFYAWGEPTFVFVVLASGMADYLLGSWLAPALNHPFRKSILALGVCANIVLLIYCKYMGFFLSTLGSLLGGIGFPMPDVFLPLGISFIIFEKITYLVDVYRATTKPARNLSDYLFFIFFFPKMLAGPIIKYHEISAQIEKRSISMDDIEYGISRFVMGMAKKVLVADPLAGVADKVFAAPLSDIGFVDAWLAALCFTILIYFDFSGYSDMAIGLARTLGFRLRENFNQPYLAIGFTDFWQRWHISLSSWIRDYLYIPLGGSRRSPSRVFVNLWTCFLASGLWHGADWTFVIWGAYHGLFVSADRLLMLRIWPRWPRWIAVGATFILVLVGWVLFRARTLPQALGILEAMANPFKPSMIHDLWITTDIYLFLAVGLAVSFVPLPIARAAMHKLPDFAIAAVRQVSVLTMSLWAFGQLFSVSFKPFLYFRF